MRIFLVCQQSIYNHPIPAYQFWKTYFRNGIAEAGYEWVEAQDVDWAKGLVNLDKYSLKKWREHSWNITVDSIKKQHQIKPIDIFLSYLFPQQVELQAVQEIQLLGIPCINFFCDNVRNFLKIPKEFSCFDIHWVPEFKAIKMYQQAGLRYVYAPMPVWIPPHKRTYCHPENYGISFIGSQDIQREALLAQVLKLGISLEIRGEGWNQENNTEFIERFQDKNLLKTFINQLDFLQRDGFLSYKEKIMHKFQPKKKKYQFQNSIKAKPNPQEYTQIIQESLITLGINRYPSFRYPFSQPDTYSRMRDIEAPMMGACYLTEWTEGLNHLYDLGEEIETYHSSEELVEKIRELEKNSEKRKNMRYKAQRRALAEHTVARSISKISDALGLKK
ncbi:glycosyltransferase [Scytonema sp. UIC 10036]|uniref:glycosyltransferase family protein n=1 Tax=Scytonema sp. UIC 10036 TaxID=2304196 RepID=UPI0012DA2E72|nr:glycosyltransferase [Scytonema sp. UIC 10036]MUG94045.1 glycosyltransferase [Scytonema sp. UIC 10036]